MKKPPLVLAAMLLLCSPAFSQEADELGDRGAEFSAIVRAEYPLGNTSVYTLYEGNISSNLSFSISNHWFALDAFNLDATKALYGNTLRSDDVNWLDWAYLTYSIGDYSSLANFEISVGKDMMVWGTYEMDEYDYDIHLPFASSVWNNLQVYQWGAKFSWLPFEGAGLDLRLSSSPYSEYPYSDALMTLGLRARYDTDDYGVRLAAHCIGAGAGEYATAFSAGAKYVLNDLTLTLDWSSMVGDEEDILIPGNSLGLQANYSFLEQFELIGKFQSEMLSGGMNWNTAGLALHYYPCESIRVHALGGYCFGNVDFIEDVNSPVFSLGITYTFSR